MDTFVTISTNNKELKVNKTLLCQESKFFETMFKSGMMETFKDVVTMKFDNQEYETCFIDIINKKINLLDENILMVLTVANQYEFWTPIQKCIDKLISINLNLD